MYFTEFSITWHNTFKNWFINKCIHRSRLTKRWFVTLKIIVPLQNFSLILRRHHCRWRAVNFDLCSTLMAIKQWRFFYVPHSLRHGSTHHNGHLRGPMTIKPVAECFYDLGFSRPGIEPRSPACEANVLPLPHRVNKALNCRNYVRR